MGTAVAGDTTGTYVGSSLTEHNQYVISSEAETFRRLLADTGCFRVVAPGTPSELVLVCQLQSEPNLGWTIPVQFLEGLILTPIFGVPYPVRGTGSASANIHLHPSGELESSDTTEKIALIGWTTLYTSRSDAARGLEALRVMAMRDLTDWLARAVCTES